VREIMRKLIYVQMVSLDGYMEGPGGNLDWSAPSEELHRHFNNLYLQGEIDLSFYGRRLYENMAGYWPEIKENSGVPEVEKEFARAWKKVPKIVFSRTLKSTKWNSTLAREVIPQEIQHIKNQPGGMIEVAGAHLAATFLKLGLVDQVWLYLHPVVLGGGKRMFPAELNLKLDHIDTEIFPCEVIRLRYGLHNHSKVPTA
jgi:dihydrofolate reductase